MISCFRSSFSQLLGQQNFRFISALKIFHAQYKQCRFVILVTWEFRYCSQKLGENHYNEPEKAKLAVLCAFWPGGQEFVRTQEFSTLCYIIQLSWSNRRTSKIAREDNPATSNQCIVLTKSLHLNVLAILIDSYGIVKVYLGLQTQRITEGMHWAI